MAKAPDHVGLWIFFNELRYKFETLKENFQTRLHIRCNFQLILNQLFAIVIDYCDIIEELHQNLMELVEIVHVFLFIIVNIHNLLWVLRYFS
jgi:hypothetical protein